MANTALGTPQGVPSSTDFLGSFKPPKSTSEAIERESELISQMAGATKAEGEAAAKAGVEKAKLQAPIVKKEAEAQTAAMGEFKSAADKMQDLEFKPTQESLMSLTGIASLTAIIGLMLGKTGGFSGQSAIDSMTGMMKGYQQGKADIFKQEQATFEKNMQAQKANLDKLKNKLDIAMKAATTNRQAAEADIAVMLAEIDSDYLKAKYNKEGLKGLIDSVAKLEEMFAKRDKLAMDARIKSEAKTGLKPGAESQKNYVGNNVMLSDIKSLMTQLQDPELKKMVDDSRLAGWLMENTGTAIAQIITTDMDPKLQKFLSTVARVRNNEYLRVSGKAVTGGEAMRNYNVVAQPGDNAEKMFTKLGGMADQIDRSITMDRKMFPSLPDLRGVESGSQPFRIDSIQLAPEEQAPVPVNTQAEYDALPPGALYVEEGKTYRKPKK